MRTIPNPHLHMPISDPRDLSSHVTSGPHEGLAPPDPWSPLTPLGNAPESRLPALWHVRIEIPSLTFLVLLDWQGKTAQSTVTGLAHAFEVECSYVLIILHLVFFRSCLLRTIEWNQSEAVLLRRNRLEIAPLFLSEGPCNLPKIQTPRYISSY